MTLLFANDGPNPIIPKHKKTLYIISTGNFMGLLPENFSVRRSGDNFDEKKQRKFVINFRSGLILQTQVQILRNFKIKRERQLKLSFG